MSMIYSLICTIFFASAVSAVVAPPVVYSAVIHNAEKSPIHCQIIWSKPEGELLESGLITIEKKEDYHTDKKIIDMGTWQAQGIIQEIRCGELVLTAPFDGVESPKSDWEFTVHSNKIVSG